MDECKVMTLREFVALMDKTSDERDVYTDYTDDLDIAYVGDDEVKMSDACLTYFADILDLNVLVDEFDAVVKINQYDDAKAERLNELLMEFFQCAAGYCSTERYHQLFNNKKGA